MSAGATSSDPSLLRVAWGGVGGGALDAWQHRVRHDYPASAVEVDSPRVTWRSVAGATAGTRLVLDACGAGATVDDGSRWVHSAIALYGLENRQVVVTYADDEAGLVNAGVATTLTTTQYTGVRIASASGRHLSVTRPVGSWRDGDLSGRFIRLTAAASASAVNQLFKIERHISDGSIDRLVLAEGGQFAYGGITAGDTAAVFADRAWASYGQTVTRRFLILGFGQTGDNNWAGRWTCGTVVPGLERTFSAVLSWSHTDEHEPHVIVQRTRGGQTWAYQDAPPERVWTGRWQGSTEGEHAAFRDALQYLARYGEEPCAILLNTEHDEDQDRSVLLARYSDSIDLDRQFYRRAAGSTSQAWAGGDTSLRFTEIT
jgi:hypothetical protein